MRQRKPHFYCFIPNNPEKFDFTMWPVIPSRVIDTCHFWHASLQTLISWVTRSSVGKSRHCCKKKIWLNSDLCREGWKQPFKKRTEMNSLWPFVITQELVATYRELYDSTCDFHLRCLMRMRWMREQETAKAREGQGRNKENRTLRRAAQAIGDGMPNISRLTVGKFTPEIVANNEFHNCGQCKERHSGNFFMAWACTRSDERER